MSLAPIGLQAGVGPVGPPQSGRRPFLSKEEHALLTAHEYTRAFERLREEEELKRRVKEQQKRRKREQKKKKAKAKAQAKSQSPGLKRKSTVGRLKTYLKVKVLRRRS